MIIIQHSKFKLTMAGSIMFYGSINMSEINDLSEILQNPEMLAVYLAAKQQQLQSSQTPDLVDADGEDEEDRVSFFVSFIFYNVHLSIWVFSFRDKAAEPPKIGESLFCRVGERGIH